MGYSVIAYKNSEIIQKGMQIVSLRSCYVPSLPGAHLVAKDVRGEAVLDSPMYLPCHQVVSSLYPSGLDSI